MSYHKGPEFTLFFTCPCGHEVRVQRSETEALRGALKGRFKYEKVCGGCLTIHKGQVVLT